MNSEIRTQDIRLVPALLALGHKVLKVDRTDPKRATFVFERTDEIESNIEKFKETDLLLGAKQLYSATRQMWDMIKPREDRDDRGAGDRARIGVPS